MGGLGIPKAEDISDMAFVSSVGSSWPLQPPRVVRNGYNLAVERISQLGITVPTLSTKFVLGDSPLTSITKEFRQSTLMLAAYAERRQLFWLFRVNRDESPWKEDQPKARISG